MASRIRVTLPMIPHDNGPGGGPKEGSPTRSRSAGQGVWREDAQGGRHRPSRSFGTAWAELQWPPGAAAGEKKPTWRHTRRYAATSAYSSTDPPARTGLPFA